MTAAAMTGAGSARPGALRLLLRNHLASAGLALLAAILLLVLITPFLPLADPDVTEPANRLLRPLAPDHLLGTDHLGRDILSRLLWGSGTSLLVGLMATLVAAFFGSLIGILAGYFGGWLDGVLMRGVDMVMAFPYILLALAIVAALGPGLLNALYAIAVVNIPFFARNIRGVTLGLVRREFVDAARLSGKSNAAILVTEILPNVLPVIVITMSTTLGWMILETAGLSFLGLGAQPPQADLGSMLGEGRKLLITAPHVSIIPGVMIFLLVVSINVLGDGIRDVLDPRLKSGALARPQAVTEVTRDSPPAPRDGDATLSLRELHTQFVIGAETYRAVDDVSFDLGKGESLALVGESGSGKSVTALSILGLVATPPGRIVAGGAYLRGEDLLTQSAERLRAIRGGDVAYVFQDPLTTLHPLLRVGEQVAEALRAHQPLDRRQAWEKSVSLLEAVRIPNARQRAKAYPHELSGGMRQRIGIAMALANEPSVIIADEPTTALDVTVQAQVLKLLDQLRGENDASLLFITHDFGVVSEICDRVAVMYAGRIVELGPTDQILTHPAHPYTKR
ncbi:MAG: dipeptide/oligopeptide/nickel ABC transporter permease/ATP-binding protein, partial [Kiloniellales bacterium]|nr:dipeptide/oligopeptide/nickel ABC transporter permease/ATP-binding protein [Kiloniellales bacterium]